MKTIRFTDHALEEIAERKMTFDEVVALLRRSTQVVPDKQFDFRTIYQEKIISRRGKPLLLRIVVEEDENEIVVVTSYVTSRIKRYWREIS
jgi:F0F1-type ATP synthase delta subunit